MIDNRPIPRPSQGIRDFLQHCPSCRCFVKNQKDLRKFHSPTSNRQIYLKTNTKGIQKNTDRRPIGQAYMKEKVLWYRSISPKPKKIILKFLSPQRTLTLKNNNSFFERKQEGITVNKIKNEQKDMMYDTETTLPSPIKILEENGSQNDSLKLQTSDLSEERCSSSQYSFKPSQIK